ncbi:MAG: hypothetical protein WCI45_07870 [Desulfuromonadales bacterium]
MNTDDELRDFFAAFAMNGLVGLGYGISYDEAAETSYEIADAMIEARKPKKPEPEAGITAVKLRRKKDV